MLLSLLREDVSDDTYRSVTGLAEHIMDVSGMDRAFPVDGRVVSAHRGGGLTKCVRESTFCGALAVIVAAIYCVLEPEDAIDSHDRVMDWFCEEFGGYDCESISSAQGFDREHHCPKLILHTYLRLREHIENPVHLARKSVLY
jgi:hypothetical protein